MKPLFAALTGALLLAGAAACTTIDPGQVEPKYRNFTLELDYANAAGADPVATLDCGSSSTAMAGNCAQGLAWSRNVDERTLSFHLNSFEIKDELGSYRISDRANSITAQSLVNGSWSPDPDFALTTTPIEAADVVLVLDVSPSLGDDFFQLRSQAANTVKKLSQNIKQLRVGVVAFSTRRWEAPLGTPAAAMAFINQLQLQDTGKTALYDAMAQGLTMLQPSTLPNQYLITFCDGADNASRSHTPATLAQQLQVAKAATVTGQSATTARVKSIMVGYDHNTDVDASQLKALALNGGSYYAPTRTEEIETSFNRLATHLMATTSLHLKRSDQPGPGSRKVRFNLRCQLLY